MKFPFHRYASPVHLRKRRAFIVIALACWLLTFLIFDNCGPDSCTQAPTITIAAQENYTAPIQEEPANNSHPELVDVDIFDFQHLVFDTAANLLPAVGWAPSDSALMSQFSFGGFAVRSSEVSPNNLIQLRPKIINICHPQWHGIREATYGQGIPVLELPGVVSTKHEKLLVHFLRQLPLELLIVNGIPPSIIQFLGKLKAYMPRLKTAVIYHGSPSQVFHPQEAGLVDQMIDAYKRRVINRIAVVKVGFGQTFTSLGVPAYEVWNFPNKFLTLPSHKARLSRKKYHIGVFGSSMVHKNVPTQILALCSLSNVVIHVLEKPELPYLRHCTSPIIQHGAFLEHNVFIQLLLSMDVNMYISLTECFPMMVTESISAGIPALTSATSAIYSVDKTLEEFLVVNELDTPDLIAKKVRRVLDNYDFISKRVRQLVPWLYFKASREWKIFIQGMPQTLLPNLPSVLLNVSVPPVDIQRFEEVKPTVVFITYELYPISTFGGGAGVVISGLVVELLEAGHDVVVIVDMNEAMPKRYIDYVQKVTDKYSRLSVYDAGTVLRQAGILSTFQESKSIFLTKSRMFARALDLIYRRNPFDIIECFDYAGVCYELLRHQYVPSSVLITVRLHGTLQLIDQSEHAVAEHTTERKLMYLQEQYALESADILWCQSTFMKKFYSTVYGLNDDKMVLSHPPMKQILRPFEELLNSTNVMTSDVSSDQPVFLVYGRMQLVKGLETIVSGAVDLLLKSSKLNRGRFIFAGPDTVLLKRRISTSQYLQSLIPRNLTHHFQFVLNPLTRKDLVQMSKKVRAAIFASDFETFNLAAHELVFLRVPLILSRIPAFTEFFDSRKSFFFEPSDTKSFQYALTRCLDHQTIIEDVRKDNQIPKYIPPGATYKLYHKNPQRRKSLKSEMLERHIDSLIRVVESD